MITNNRLNSFTREDFRFFSTLSTRWGDCDMMGHINNVILLRYLESGRIEYMKDLLNVDMIASSREGIIIAEISASFRSQVNHPADLDVGVRISRLGNSSMDFESAIFLPSAPQPALTSKATLVWFDYQLNTSIPIPQAARDQITKFEGIQS